MKANMVHMQFKWQYYKNEWLQNIHISIINTFSKYNREHIFSKYNTEHVYKCEYSSWREFQ